MKCTLEHGEMGIVPLHYVMEGYCCLVGVELAIESERDFHCITRLFDVHMNNHLRLDEKHGHLLVTIQF